MKQVIYLFAATLLMISCSSGTGESGQKKSSGIAEQEIPTGIQIGQRAPELVFRSPEGKKIAFFSTHGSLTGSRLSREALENATVLSAKAHVLGTFSCRGKVSHQALDILMKSPEHEAWAMMAASAATHPDASDLEDARNFAAWIQTIAASKRRPA